MIWLFIDNYNVISHKQVPISHSYQKYLAQKPKPIHMKLPVKDESDRILSDLSEPEKIYEMPLVDDMSDGNFSDESEFSFEITKLDRRNSQSNPSVPNLTQTAQLDPDTYLSQTSQDQEDTDI